MTKWTNWWVCSDREKLAVDSGVNTRSYSTRHYLMLSGNTSQFYADKFRGKRGKWSHSIRAMSRGPAPITKPLCQPYQGSMTGLQVQNTSQDTSSKRHRLHLETDHISFESSDESAPRLMFCIYRVDESRDSTMAMSQSRYQTWRFGEVAFARSAFALCQKSRNTIRQVKVSRWICGL